MKAVAPTTFARMSESLMSRKPLHKRLSRGFATRRSLPPIVEKNWRQKLPGGSPQGCEMPERTFVPEDLYRLVLVGDPQISPDGRSVAFVRSHVEGEKRELRSHIWLVPEPGAPPR